MKKIGIDEYRSKLLIILKDIDSFCSINNLTYFLEGGSLLGAVRHKGFIPWDDDIDLSMPRKDYEFFISFFKSDVCMVTSFHNTNDYYYPYAKVNLKGSKVLEKGIPEIQELGINIDVFPLDGMPNNYLLRRFHQDHLMLLNKTSTLLVRASSILPRSFFYYLPWKNVLQRIDSLGKKYRMEKCDYCGNIVATTVRHNETPRNCFQNMIRLEFEGELYPAPEGYKTYLSTLYGSYMELPPVDKQVSNHNFEAYIDEKFL